MLKEFRVSNYMSINKEQIFSMEACPLREVSEHPDHVINYKGERLLKVSSFYGPNGGGKSNLLTAYAAMVSVIANSNLVNPSFGNDSSIKCVFCKNNETKFEAFFVTESFEIGYSLTLDLTKTKEPQISGFEYRPLRNIDYAILREEFSFRHFGEKEFTTLFERNSDGIVNSVILSDVDLVNNSFALPKSKSFINYFENSFQKTTENNIFKPLFEFIKEIKGAVFLNREYRSYSFEPQAVTLISPHLGKIADILNGIDIRVKKLAFEKTLPHAYCLYIYRETIDGKLTELQLANESKGTRKLINIIIDVLTNDFCTLFLADDFDACLHPKLIRTIIDFFTSPKNKKKQLLFNSHDIINMNNKVFRRDEIWFAYRDDSYATKYMPLSNIVNYQGKMVRKDAVFGKQYLEGKFGADPFIRQGLDWN